MHEMENPDNPINDPLLYKRARCQRCYMYYSLNVFNNGRLEAGKCPHCYPHNNPQARTSS